MATLFDGREQQRPDRASGAALAAARAVRVYNSLPNFPKIGSSLAPTGNILALIAMVHGKPCVGEELARRPIKGEVMKLRKKPIVSAVALALMSMVQGVQ